MENTREMSLRSLPELIAPEFEQAGADLRPNSCPPAGASVKTRGVLGIEPDFSLPDAGGDWVLAWLLLPHNAIRSELNSCFRALRGLEVLHSSCALTAQHFKRFFSWFEQLEAFLQDWIDFDEIVLHPTILERTQSISTSGVGAEDDTDLPREERIIYDTENAHTILRTKLSEICSMRKRVGLGDLDMLAEDLLSHVVVFVSRTLDLILTKETLHAGILNDLFGAWELVDLVDSKRRFYDRLPGSNNYVRMLAFAMGWQTRDEQRATRATYVKSVAQKLTLPVLLSSYSKRVDLLRELHHMSERPMRAPRYHKQLSGHTGSSITTENQSTTAPFNSSYIRSGDEAQGEHTAEQTERVPLHKTWKSSGGDVAGSTNSSRGLRSSRISRNSRGLRSSRSGTGTGRRLSDALRELSNRKKRSSQKHHESGGAHSNSVSQLPTPHFHRRRGSIDIELEEVRRSQSENMGDQRTSTDMSGGGARPLDAFEAVANRSGLNSRSQSGAGADPRRRSIGFAPYFTSDRASAPGRGSQIYPSLRQSKSHSDSLGQNPNSNSVVPDLPSIEIDLSAAPDAPSVPPVLPYELEVKRSNLLGLPMTGEGPAGSAARGEAFEIFSQRPTLSVIPPDIVVASSGAEDQEALETSESAPQQQILPVESNSVLTFTDVVGTAETPSTVLHFSKRVMVGSPGRKAMESSSKSELTAKEAGSALK
eukprot:CAMPEP_0185858108 /NCGR_PEP_ID=MMETSP1354-20130828/29845_1 /TAXON_ID=708628 /ORGANISM="Erythrolobus madagascarensis, Strain CCMP3276" /LENGTH=706 /DNA_ID=CAMNT_0028560389 /DNA_START=455 /DNA_END=2575 /DNA_ORIENTATION=-